MGVNSFDIRTESSELADELNVSLSDESDEAFAEFSLSLSEFEKRDDHKDGGLFECIRCSETLARLPQIDHSLEKEDCNGTSQRKNSESKSRNHSLLKVFFVSRLLTSGHVPLLTDGSTGRTNVPTRASPVHTKFTHFAIDTSVRAKFT
jgi:hypothetical protein